MKSRNFCVICLFKKIDLGNNPEKGLGPTKVEIDSLTVTWFGTYKFPFRFRIGMFASDVTHQILFYYGSVLHWFPMCNLSFLRFWSSYAH